MSKSHGPALIYSARVGNSSNFAGLPALRLEPSDKMRSRVCDPCKARGVKAIAHRVTVGGKGLCYDCFLDWQKEHPL